MCQVKKCGLFYSQKQLIQIRQAWEKNENKTKWNDSEVAICRTITSRKFRKTKNSKSSQSMGKQCWIDLLSFWR